MKRSISTTALLLCLLPWLAGCALFGSDVVPPESKALGMAAQDIALKENIRPGHGDQPDVFVPLRKAHEALNAAADQPDVKRYAADQLADARSKLTAAEQLWQNSHKKGDYDIARLAQIEADAHAARRLAEIARYTAMREINLASLNGSREQLQHREASNKPAGNGGVRGTRVVPGKLGKLSFQPGTARMTSDSNKTVSALASLLSDQPDKGVIILAYTDNSRPSKQALESFKQANPQLQSGNLSQDQLVDAYHLALSTAQARVVGRALVQAGVKSQRIGAKGFGERRPVADNSTEKGRAANRRVVAIIVPGPGQNNSPLRGPAP